MNEPLDMQLLIFIFLNDNIFSFSPESNKINDVSSPSPKHETLLASRFSISILLYTKRRSPLEFVFIFSNLIFRRVYFDSSPNKLLSIL